MKKVLIGLMVMLITAGCVFAADSEVQDLDAISSPAVGDVLYVVDDPAGTPASKKITIGNLLDVGTDLNSSGEVVGGDADTAATATLASTVTVSDDESTDDAHEIVFTTDNSALESDGTCTYNPSTGVITTTGFVGALTGNVTGDCSGNAATATALAANPAACSAGEFVNDIAANGTLTCAAPSGSGDVTGVGDCASGACLDGTSDGGTNILFYDAQGATTIAVGDNSGAVTLTLPIATGTLLTADGVGTSLTALNGENIQDDTIDDDSVDFSDITCADLTMTDCGAVTSTGAIDFGGATLEVPNAAAPTTDAAGEIALDTTITDHQPLLQYYDGGENMSVIAIDTAQLPALDNEIVKYDAATDKFVLEADAGSATATLWLLPESAVLDDTSPPSITVIESTGTGTPRRRVADFDAATDEILYWSFDWRGYTTATVYWYSNDTGADETCYWSAQISATTEADADTMAEDAGDTTNLAYEDTNGTEANRLILTPITLTNADSAATGDFVTLIFSRDANNGSDDLSSDARLLGVLLQ